MSSPGPGLIVDLFAGGGGASTGIRMALGRDPDVAINHDPVAVAMHRANHPGTLHYRQDVWVVSPRGATKGRPVSLLWASPDCRHHSKAKGGPPKRDVKVRDLAWVVEKWAYEVNPALIILENVEEFADWGPLDAGGKVIKSQKGTTFAAFVRSLRRLGYAVEWNELVACDYGAPTSRKRLFLIARCDGRPIVWPRCTHEDRSSPRVISGLMQPWKTAADIIDFSLPCPSIFDRKKPLVENALRRIAKGTMRYVVQAAEPFILNYHGAKSLNEFRGSGLHAPLRTQTTENRFALVVPHIQRQFGNSVGHAASVPLGTIMAGGSGKTAMITAALMAQHNGGMIGRPVDTPLSTLTSRGTQQQLVAAFLTKFRGSCRDGQAIDRPLPTLTSGGCHVAEVRALLLKYYGSDGCGQRCDSPLHTITTRDRFGLVIVSISGEPHVIVDIGMRMLSPRELFLGQGFPSDYIIDVSIDGKPITKEDQVRMCGNSVSPPPAEALVSANFGVGEGRDRGMHRQSMSQMHLFRAEDPRERRSI